MVRLAGGEFLMGSNIHYPEEAPQRPVAVAPFWIDVAPLTNREFARFMAQSGHITLAEKASDPDQYPGALPEMMRAGSLVFHTSVGTGSAESARTLVGLRLRRGLARRSGAEEAVSRDPAVPELLIGRRVLKGGSHLCGPSYCQRYRPAAPAKAVAFVQ